MRWLGFELPELRAGVCEDARVLLENCGTAAWRGGERGTVRLSYHWLDELGNPIVWDGPRTRLRLVEPGEEFELAFRLRSPIPPGRYRLAIDLVDEGRCWFAELGNGPLEVAVRVGSRLRRRALAVRIEGQASEQTKRALAGQDEALVAEEEAEAIAYLAPGCLPRSDWSSHVLDAHNEGYAIVAGSIDIRSGLLRRRPTGLSPWAPGVGRVPSFARPLLCPSVVKDLEPEWVDPVFGLPAVNRPRDEPWLYDGSIELRVHTLAR